MFDFNKLDEYRTCLEVTKASRISWVSRKGIIKLQIIKKDNLLCIEDTRIHNSDWEEFKTEVANHFLSSY